MARLPNFVLIQRPGLAQQSKKGKKSSLWLALSGIFLQAECSNPLIDRYQKLKFWNFTTSSFCSSKHKQKHIFPKTIRKLHTNMFSSKRRIGFNSSLLLTGRLTQNNYPRLFFFFFLHQSAILTQSVPCALNLAVNFVLSRSPSLIKTEL